MSHLSQTWPQTFHRGCPPHLSRTGPIMSEEVADTTPKLSVIDSTYDSCELSEQKRRKPKQSCFGFLKWDPGGDLLSHTKNHAVPSAQKSLTTEFGMGSGVTSSQ